ncbi:hypothetical protein GCM10010525_16840 [Glutamicibacter bergerei]
MAEMEVMPAKIKMTMNHIIGLALAPVKEDIPEENCMAAKPKDVAKPSTVAIIASSSTTTPAPRRD